MDKGALGAVARALETNLHLYSQIRQQISVDASEDQRFTDPVQLPD